MLSKAAVWLAVAAILSVAVGVPALAPALNLFRFTDLPAGVWMAGIVGPLSLALLSALIVARGSPVRRSFMAPLMAPVVLAVSGAALASSIDAIYELGFDGFAIPLGLAAGSALAVLYWATLRTPDSDEEVRLPAVAHACGLAILSVALVFVLAAEVRVGLVVLEGLTPSTLADFFAAEVLATVTLMISLVIAVGPGRQSADGFAILFAGFGGLLVWLSANWFAGQTGAMPFVQGELSTTINALANREQVLIERGLSDFSDLKPMASPFLNVSLGDSIGSIVAFALGVLSISWLAGQSSPRLAAERAHRRRPSRWLIALSFVLAGILLTSLAGVVLFSRLALADAISNGLTVGALPAGLEAAYAAGWIELCGAAAPSDAVAACAVEQTGSATLRLNDIVFRADSFFAAAPLVAGFSRGSVTLYWAGLFLAVVAGLIAVFRATIPLWYGLAPDGQTGRNAVAAVLAGFALTAAALALALNSDATIPMLLEYGLAIAAAGLCAAGFLIRRQNTHDPAPYLIAMATGVIVLLGYLIAVRMFPSDVMAFAGILDDSNIDDLETIEIFEALKAAVAGASTAVERSDAIAARDAFAASLISDSLPRPATMVLAAVPLAVVAGWLTARLLRRA